ncbi:MAG: pyridoxamine 5'-phosphate oxidase family protein [Candidatus Nitrosopolaris sp.]|jgi:nitroimidazol reductase NimA-like FMN-containing flavoprotein (pyridoxamine 5'-phosphate oxidase superfamily)
MQLIKRLEIQSKQRIFDFLNSEPVGRISTIDVDGYPQVIPMNFVYVHAIDPQVHSRQIIKIDAVYMHSHPLGEKLDNIKRNSKVGFEIDRHVCYLPSYYFHPSDASQADTLYISVVIKGNAMIVDDNEEKTEALNSLMEKYQKEGKYESLDSYMPSVQEVTVIKLIPQVMRGKYKIGQHWSPAYRLKMARNIVDREGGKRAKDILDIMGINILTDGNLKIREEPLM